MAEGYPDKKTAEVDAEVKTLPAAKFEEWYMQAMAEGHATKLEAEAPEGTEIGPGGSWDDGTIVHCDAQVTAVAQYPVYYQTPQKKKWDEDWDDCEGVVFLFHGTDMQFSSDNVEFAFRAEVGSYYAPRVQTVKKLLEEGFAVVAPEARQHKTTNGMGFTFWVVEKESYQMWKDWRTSKDAKMMDALFERFKDVEVHAMGFSSGSYHVSRVANEPEYAGKLNTATILAGGSIPTGFIEEFTIVPDHPPTQLLQGEGDDTLIENPNTNYYEALQAAGVDARSITDKAEIPFPYGPDKGEIMTHLWLPESPKYITEWIQGHRGPRELKGPPEGEDCSLM